jgi:flagellar hook-associated protein 2
VSSLGLSGLASGVDTASIVSQLMALERQKTSKLTSKQSRTTAEQTALKGIQTKLAALKTATEALKKDSGAWALTQTVESSDPARVAVAKISGAGAGGHSIQVDRLAASAQRGFTVDLAALKAGTTITVGARTFTFAANPDAKLEDIVAKVNADADAPVYAALVKKGTEDRLIFSARTTGESSRFTASSPALTEDTSYESLPDALNAQYRLDGGAVTPSETNVLENAIPGLRLTLKGVTAAAASVVTGAPDVDRSAAKTKVKAIVDAYNALVDTTRTAVNEKSVINPSSTFDANKGTLFGDTGLNAMLSNLRNDLRAPLDGIGDLGSLGDVDDLGDLGIGVPKSTGGASSAEARAGRFTIDDAKLTAALDKDWTKVRSFMDAFATKIGEVVDKQTGKTESLLDQRVVGTTKRSKTLADQLVALNARLDDREKRLKAQFAAMEAALQSAQTQGNWLTGQINALG